MDCDACKGTGGPSAQPCIECNGTGSKCDVCGESCDPGADICESCRADEAQEKEATP